MLTGAYRLFAKNVVDVGIDEAFGGQDVNVISLRAGCKSCEALLNATKEAVASKGIDTEVEYITDMEKVMSYGVMSMPVLVIDGKVVSAGKVLKAKEVEKLL